MRRKIQETERSIIHTSQSFEREYKDALRLEAHVDNRFKTESKQVRISGVGLP